MDNERPKQSVSLLKDFVGLYSDVEDRDIPNGGMAEQINIFSKKTGSLETRGGLVEVTLTLLE